MPSDAFYAKINQLDAKTNIALRGKKERKQRKNRDFFMIFKTDGAPLLRELTQTNAFATVLFFFLCEKSDKSNAFIASHTALAQYLGVSPATVKRAIKVLREKEVVDVLKSGNTNLFVLNPQVVWSSWANQKGFCLFGNAKVLLAATEQSPEVRKRIGSLETNGELKAVRSKKNMLVLQNESRIKQN